MKLPNLEQAERLLLEAESRNPGPWVPHVRNVALAAKLISENHPRLEPEAAFIMGLLHDIGRREGVTGMRHTLDGYRYLLEQGFDDAARICLTHSFPIKDIRAGLGKWDVNDQEYAFIETFLAEVNYNDYDRLIQLCDALAMAEGICLMEKRIVDAVIRLGFNEVTQEKWKAWFKIKKTLELEIGCSIYSLFPNVVETTFGLAEQKSPL